MGDMWDLRGTKFGSVIWVTCEILEAQLLFRLVIWEICGI